jgi:galactose mutarotase-like enzyme
MNITIQNKLLKASINTKGAELFELEFLPSNKNVLWHGDATYWSKHSPILFPIVGSLVNNEYTLGHKTYTLSRHGFARDMNWALKEANEVSCVFVLESNEATLACYPFKFSLEIHYLLNDNCLTCTYYVKNAGTADMYFSLGAHPAFIVPFENDNTFEDYYLLFNNNQNRIIRHKLNENGLFNDTTENIDLINGKLPLTPQLFYEDAIVLKELHSNEITVSSDKNKDINYQFSWANFPHFGIWQPKNAPFICLEPWQGFADNALHNGDFTKKPGIIKLSNQQVWNANWRIKINL